MSLVALLWASIEDLKTSEIPEICSVGLAALLLLLALVHTVSDGNIHHILRSAYMGAVMLAVGYALFVLGQWGGGDVKLLAGVGCLIGYLDSTGYVWPLSSFVTHPIPPGFTYFINMAVLSTPYVILYTLVLGFMKPHAFTAFSNNLRERKVMLALLLSFTPLLIALYFGFSTLSLIYLLVPLLVMASVYMKTVENTVLRKTVRVSDMREWDIVAEDVVVDGVKIASKRNIEGVTPEQLARIREFSAAGKLPETMEIKWGVKFAPILFLSLLATIYFGSLLEMIFLSILQVH